MLQIGANEYKWVQNAKVSSNTATIFTFLNLSRIREHYKKEKTHSKRAILMGSRVGVLMQI